MAIGFKSHTIFDLEFIFLEAAFKRSTSWKLIAITRHYCHVELGNRLLACMSYIELGEVTFCFENQRKIEIFSGFV